MAKVLYGVLDEFGEVLRWQWDKPSSAYRFVIKRLKPLPRLNVGARGNAFLTPCALLRW